MKKCVYFVLCLLLNNVVIAQTYSTEYKGLGSYIQRMYLNEPFQGIKIVTDVDNSYLIAVVAEQNNNNDYATQRKAEIKALNYANEFLNGAHVSGKTVLHTSKDSIGHTYEEIEEFIVSRSMGNVQQMQIISIFEDKQNKRVFVFCKDLPVQSKNLKQKKKKKSK